MEKSQTAVRKGISNKAGSGEIKNLTDLCYEVLEPVRIKFDKPVIITSGYRSPELCEAIGSKATSQHAKGQAVDFEIAGVSNLQVALWLTNNVDFDQLILEYWTGEAMLTKKQKKLPMALQKAIMKKQKKTKKVKRRKLCLEDKEHMGQKKEDHLKKIK